ncbi:glutathione S-transferase family protein [Parvibaculaceae bacterium PLY_AMNH_Bact1]|nr:glutathione S-transferase family protein [Parvibaculaceae bacterium PLY_AMNH_Bact1]
MKIHMFSGSGFAWRIQLVCELKGIPYDPAYMQPTPQKLKSEAFLKLSPRGKVPAIEADGFSLSESLAIMAYLEAKHPERPLFGTTPEATGRIWQKCLDFDLYVSGDFIPNLIAPIVQGRAANETDALRQGAEVAHEELAKLEAGVEASGWMVGDNISAADVTLYTMIEPVLRFATKPDILSLGLGFDSFASRYPKLQAWREKVQSLPEYDVTYPTYWREVDQQLAAAS